MNARDNCIVQQLEHLWQWQSAQCCGRSCRGVSHFYVVSRSSVLLFGGGGISSSSSSSGGGISSGGLLALLVAGELVDEQVVVRGEEGARADRFAQRVDDGVCDRESVVRGGAAAELVEQHEAVLRALTQSKRRLLELDEERALAAQNAVRRAQPREDAVHRREYTLVRRHIAACTATLSHLMSVSRAL